MEHEGYEYPEEKRREKLRKLYDIACFSIGATLGYLNKVGYLPDDYMRVGTIFLLLPFMAAYYKSCDYEEKDVKKKNKFKQKLRKMGSSILATGGAMGLGYLTIEGLENLGYL